MPGAVGPEVGPDAGQWFGPSVDLTVHLLGADGAGLAARATTGRVRPATATRPSTMALWMPTGGHELVAYATQLMFFAFGV